LAILTAKEERSSHEHGEDSASKAQFLSIALRVSNLNAMQHERCHAQVESLQPILQGLAEKVSKD
jgi:hypothetical protein